jgi:hypothetical protein
MPEITEQEAMGNTFVMPGKSQPKWNAATTATLYVPDETKAYFDSLHLEASTITEYCLITPTGDTRTAMFMRWHGAHALFYVPGDDVTVTMWYSDIPTHVQLNDRGALEVNLPTGSGKTRFLG